MNDRYTISWDERPTTFFVPERGAQSPTKQVESTQNPGFQVVDARVQSYIVFKYLMCVYFFHNNLLKRLGWGLRGGVILGHDTWVWLAAHKWLRSERRVKKYLRGYYGSGRPEMMATSALTQLVIWVRHVFLGGQAGGWPLFSCVGQWGHLPPKYPTDAFHVDDRGAIGGGAGLQSCLIWSRRVVGGGGGTHSCLHSQLRTKLQHETIQS